MDRFRKQISLVLVITLIFCIPLINLADSIDEATVTITTAYDSELVVESEEAEQIEQIKEIEECEEIEEYEEAEVEENEIIETTAQIDFIEETSSGQDINDYEREVFEKINEIIESSEESEVATETTKIFESVIDDIVLSNIEESTIETEETINEEATIEEITEFNIATYSEADELESSELDIEELEVSGITLLDTSLLGSGNHTSTASPSIVINSTYDRYEIYTGENSGIVRVFDDNGTYYNSNTKVKVIRDMIDTNNNSPILLKLASDVQFFDFDNSNDNYVLLPEGFVEDLIARESGNGYLNPQGINLLDHIKVNLIFNSTDLGMYDLFEYGVLYYLSCYEGVLGEYYYYDPNTTDVDRAASFYVNNRIMNRTYNIVSEYYYKSPSGEQLSFKPTWVLNANNLTGANKENYAKQWVNFPYFLIKTGEKYWNLRDSIEQSTYLSDMRKATMSSI